MKEGINQGVTKVIEYITKNSKSVSGDKITQVATISANNDVELGNTIGEAFKMVDETGVVVMEINDQPKTKVELIDGVQYDKGLTSNNFMTDKTRGIAELNNPLVLIVESHIENIRKIQPVLEYVIKHNESLLIIADVDRQVMNALAMNKIKGNIKINIINAPTYGVSKAETLSDLCLLTGAKLINEDLGDDMNIIQPDYLGRCIKATTNKQETILKVEANESIDEVVESLQKELKTNKNPSKVIQIEKRLARLKAKVATVKVGANSDIELKEKRDRVEDAICATKAAIKDGIVPGGGIALLNASQNLKPTSIGEEVLYCAIRKPYETILRNAGIQEYVDPDEDGRGLDVVTGNTVDMVKAGIIDPLLVTKSALMNAASVATTILSTDCVINNVRDESGR